MSCVLTLNGGSSSVKFAVYQLAPSPRAVLEGKLDRVGSQKATLTVDASGAKAISLGRADAPQFLLDWLEQQPAFAAVAAVGHRVVHGMRHTQPERVTPRLMAELHRIADYDPDHLPAEIALIQAVAKRHPRLKQVACFDTAFHRTMPHVAKLLPIPRKYSAKGVERYGFHGLSYAYLVEELGPAARGRVILAHLGNGASLAAVRDGHGIDTTMGFTPTAGLVMSTRTGDLDPGVAYYLARTQNVSGARFHQMVNHESGLLGVSGTSSDVRDLEARQAADPHAAAALELFCYQAKKHLGAMAAALGGLDTLVFSAGIGENSPAMRERICAGLEFLGVRLSGPRNAKNASIISTDASRVTVRVIKTDEELMIARSVQRVLHL